MATPPQQVAPPPQRKPSAAATLAAAGAGGTAATDAAVTPTLVATGVQARAITEGTAKIVEALAAFARQREATIIPALQSDLVEHFQTRTPDEISKLLAKEAAREREFLRRQAARMKRDLPKVLAETSVEDRKAAIDKLMSRERRYMAQREQAMTARAHSAVESLAIQEASPEGAFWMLGGPVHQHTPGCIAMSNKFWPWAVLREVTAPPVHPGCPCSLLTLDEAVAHGYMHPGQLPDVKDALIRARRNMALEEALEEALPEWAIEDEMWALEAALGGDPLGHRGETVHSPRLRYAKGLVRGGQFMPKVGGYSAQKRLRKHTAHVPHRVNSEIGRNLGRSVWISGNRVHVPENRAFSRKVGGHHYTSPPGGTNVYRDGVLASTPDKVLHPDMARPRGNAPKGRVTKNLPAPAAVTSAEKRRGDASSKRVQNALTKASPDVPPVTEGQSAFDAHRALKAAGFRQDENDATQTAGTLTVPYTHRDGHEVIVKYDRSTSQVKSAAWKPGTSPTPTAEPKAEPSTPAAKSKPKKPTGPRPSATLDTGDPKWGRQLARALAGEPDAQWDLSQESAARGPNSDFTRALREQVGAAKMRAWERGSRWPGGVTPKGAAPPRYAVERSSQGQAGPTVGIATADGPSGLPGDRGRTLGTGHYFTSQPTGGSQGDGVALLGAHLHRPYDANSSLALGRSLGILNDIADGTRDYTSGVDPNTGEQRRYTLADALENLPIEGSRDDAEAFARDAIDQHRQGSNEAAATHMMRALGYDGVDNRHLPELDHPAYGSVVYAPLGHDDTTAESPEIPAAEAAPGLGAEANRAVKGASDAISSAIDMPTPIRIAALPDGDASTARSLPSGEIAIHPDSSEKTNVNAIVHEAGHLIDRSVLGNEDEWFTQTPAADPLYQAMKNSPTMKAVRDDKMEILKGDTQTRNYILNGREMFARAFHQYVAERSGNTDLLSELRSMQRNEYTHFQVWPDAEFEPIAAEIEKVLVARGLGEPGPLKVKSYQGHAGNKDHITRDETGMIPMSALANLKGARGEVPGEHRNRQGPEWDSFVDDVRQNGVRDPIFVTVDHGEEPKISEGNHRRDAAIQAGLSHVPVEIRYFGKSEDQGTVLERGRAGMPASPAQGGAVLRGKVGRYVWIRGRVNFVPQDAKWEKESDGIRFTSPAGGTQVYRAAPGDDGLGTLVSEPRRRAMHPDVLDPRVGGTQRGAVRPRQATVSEPGESEPDPDAPPKIPDVPDGAGIKLTDEQRERLFQGVVRVGPNDPEPTPTGIVQLRSQREAVNASALPEGRITLGPVWSRMNPQERQYTLDLAFGHALADAVHKDDGGRDDLGKLWTAGKFSAQVAGETEYLDRYSANAALATAYARMGGDDWQQFAAHYPEAALFAADQAYGRGYYVRPDVHTWLQDGDNPAPPVTELPDDAKALVDGLVGKGSDEAGRILSNAGFTRHYESYSQDRTYRKVDPQTQAVHTVLLTRAPNDEYWRGQIITAAEGSSYGFDPNQEPPVGDTPERLAYEMRGLDAKDMLKRMNDAGYFSMEARSTGEGHQMENVFVRPDSDIAIMVRTPNGYREPVTDARPTTLTAAESKARLAAVARARPDLIPVGTSEGDLNGILREIPWRRTDRNGRIELTRTSNETDADTASIDMYRILLNPDGSVKEIGRPNETDGLARDDAEWQAVHAQAQHDMRTMVAERKARIAALTEDIRTSVNAAKKPDVSGYRLEEVEQALKALGYRDMNTSRVLSNGNESDTWENRETGARLTVRSSGARLNDRQVESVRVLKAGEPDLGRERTPPGEMPKSLLAMKSDMFGFSDELAKEQDAESDIVKIAYAGPNGKPGDHGGYHQQNGTIVLGNQLPGDLAKAIEASASGRTLTPVEINRVLSSYHVQAHEMLHGVHAPNQDLTYTPQDGEMGLEEWLTEDLSRQVAADWLERHGLHDVLGWWQDNEDQVYESYQFHRTNAYQLLRDMGLGESDVSNEDLRTQMETWKYRSTRQQRREDMQNRLMSNLGIPREQADQHISATMGIPKREAGPGPVDGFQPRLPVNFPPRPDPPLPPVDLDSWVTIGGDSIFAGQVGQVVDTNIDFPTDSSPEPERHFQVRLLSTGALAGMPYGKGFTTSQLTAIHEPPTTGPVPTQRLADGGTISVGSMVTQPDGQVFQVAGLQGDPSLALNMGLTEFPLSVYGYDGRIVQMNILPSRLRSVGITDAGVQVRHGDQVFDPATGTTGQVGHIDWTDASDPKTSILSNDGSVVYGASVRSLQSRGAEPWPDAPFRVPLADRQGNTRYATPGDQIWTVDGRPVTLMGAYMPDWPRGPATYQVSMSDGSQIGMTRESLLGFQDELPRPRDARTSSLASGGAIEELIHEHYRGEGGTGFNEDPAATIAAADVLGTVLGRDVGPGVVQWARMNHVPIGLRGDGQAQSGEEAIREIYTDAYKSRDSYEAVERAYPALFAATMQLAQEAGLPTPDWNRERRPGQQPIPAGPITDEAVARAIFSGEFGKRGFSTTVTRYASHASPAPGDRDAVAASVSGYIYDENGHRVGDFTRNITPIGNGEFEVEHEVLQLDQDAQGTGFATDFNNHVFEEYRKRGVTSVWTHADIDVGGYTWAATGFDFRPLARLRNDNSPEGDLLRAEWRATQANIMATNAYYSGKIEDDEWESIRPRLYDPARDDEFDPERHIHHAWDLAHIDGKRGVDPDDVEGRSIGQKIMLGTDWYGVRQLDAPPNLAITPPKPSEPDAPAIDPQSVQDWIRHDPEGMPSAFGLAAKDFAGVAQALHPGVRPAYAPNLVVESTSWNDPHEPPNGLYEPGTGQITLDIEGALKDREWFLAHEYAHHLDTTLVRSATEDRAAAEWARFQQAVSQSGMPGEVDDALASGQIDQRMHDYMLSRSEVFARAYSRWVADRSGNKRMQTSSARQYEDEFGHWTKGDFAPVAAAMDGLFAKLAEPGADDQASPEIPTPEQSAFHDKFEAVMDGNEYTAFVSHYTPEEMAEKGMVPVTDNDGNTGVLIYDHGNGDVEATALYNASDVRGAGRAMLARVVAENGVNYVECFGPDLSKLYRSLGFEDETGSPSPFSDEYAPPNWDYAQHGRPDYHVMRLAPSHTL